MHVQMLASPLRVLSAEEARLGLGIGRFRVRAGYR